MKKSQLHGRRVTCKINEIEITDARLTVIKNHVYICQNDVVTPCHLSDDEFGYKYCSELANEEDMKIAERLSDFNYWYVTDLKFVETRGRKKKEIIENEGFLKSCNAGEEAIYQAENYTCFSKKELERREKQQKPLTAPSLDLTQDNKEQVILILLEEGYKVWEKEGLLYFERIK